MRDYRRRYPKTRAIRAVAITVFAGYFYIFPRAMPLAIFVAMIVIIGYLGVKIRQFFGHEESRLNGLYRLTLPYLIFEIIWNLLSARSEVDEL
jgi:hypothetical protein